MIRLPLILLHLALSGLMVAGAGSLMRPEDAGRSAPLPEDAARPAEPRGFQERRWHEARIRPEWAGRVDSAVDRYVRTRDRYLAIERMRPAPGVPARVIFVLHGRESTWRFDRHLHEGSPLTGRTRWVPKGRPKRGSPPFTFEESAEDALYLLKDMENWDWSNLESMLQNIERYNGLGYQRYHKSVPSPYLWSGTSIYTRGKYVADGRFSRIAIDKQIGTATILKRLRQRNIP
jgi:lysozyme family protein